MVKQSEETLLSLRRNTQVLLKELVPEIRLVNLPFNTTWVYEHKLVADESGAKESNSAIISYFQFEIESLEKKLLLMLLTNYLKTPCFEQLRTKQQLGYIVAT